MYKPGVNYIYYLYWTNTTYIIISYIRLCLVVKATKRDILAVLMCF